MGEKTNRTSGEAPVLRGRTLRISVYKLISIFIYIYIIFPLQKVNHVNSDAKKWVKSEVGRHHNFQDLCAPSSSQ